MTTISDIITRKGETITELMAAPDSRWIQTFTGRPFWPLEPRQEDIHIEDIAHALSMKCRYTGHTREFYSVAQHSALASMIVPTRDRFWALMHDATEAYLPDVARPIKRNIPGFIEVEDRLMVAIAKRFGLKLPMPDSIHDADLKLLATERRDLMAAPPYRWISTENIKPLESVIEPMAPAAAKAWFLRRFEVLSLTYVK